jgi:hypothetical protein
MEQRVHRLEVNVDALEREQGQLSQALAQETAKRAEELALEQRARNDADTRLQTKLEELGAGNLHLEWLGILFLFFGVILATTSNELARLFSQCGP